MGLKFPFLLLCLLYLLKDINAINGKVLIFLFIALIASLASDDISFSLAKFLGLALVVSVLSPLIQSQKACLMRQSVWANLCLGTVFITLFSVFWKLTGLPGPVMYTRQGFPGITGHSMLFGAFAAIATIYLFCKSVSRNNYWLYGLVLVCFMATISSSSRSAIFATFIGVMVILMLAIKNERLRIFVILSLAIFTCLILLAALVPSEDAFYNFLHLDDLRGKGYNNSRDELWRDRLAEFDDNPYLGLGIGMSYRHRSYDVSLKDKFNPAYVDQIYALPWEEQYVGTIEPGSAYLVVLSMSGLIGAASILLLIADEVISLTKMWKNVPPVQQYEIAGIGAFLFIHGVAEGWIYSAGVMLCLLFWLWIGLVSDTAMVARIEQSRKLL